MSISPLMPGGETFSYVTDFKGHTCAAGLTQSAGWTPIKQVKVAPRYVHRVSDGVLKSGCLQNQNGSEAFSWLKSEHFFHDYNDALLWANDKFMLFYFNLSLCWAVHLKGSVKMCSLLWNCNMRLFIWLLLQCNGLKKKKKSYTQI